MKPILIPLFLAAALLTLGAAETELKPQAPKPPSRTASPPIKNIGVQEFEKLRGDSNNVVLDVRTPKEFAAGHIQGAINIDVNGPDFEKKAAALDPNKTYLVHCGVGVRSAKACDKLSKLRFQQLYNLEGGLKAWEKAGHKTAP